MTPWDKLFDLSEQVEWSAADGVAALRHQLAASVFPDVAAFVVRAMGVAWGQEGNPAFREVLLAERPSAEILVAIKSFARSHREAPASPLRGMPATVIYFAAIAASRAQGYAAITGLDNVALRTGFAWARRQEGAEDLRALFEKALAALGQE